MSIKLIHLCLECEQKVWLLLLEIDDFINPRGKSMACQQEMEDARENILQ